MAIPVVVQKRQPTFWDESYTQPPTSITSGAAPVRIASIRCRTGLQPYLTMYSQQIDAGGVATVTWHLFRNGVQMYPYHAHNNQTSAPQDNVKLPVPIRLEQDDFIEVYVEQTSGSAQNAIARIMVEYDDLD